MRSKRLVLTGIVACAGLGACHPDPFSIKPEVNVTLPDKPDEAAQEDAAAPEEETADEASE